MRKYGKRLDLRIDHPVLGPLDLRPIEPADIDPISHDITHHLRAVRPSEGHRAAVTASFAAILAGVIVLGELGGDDAVAEILRQHLDTAEKRVAERASGVRREVLQ